MCMLSRAFVEPESARGGARDCRLDGYAWLTDRERGGFYASQDADMSLDDDGDYFTWTRDEAAAVLTPDEMAVAGAYYDIGEMGTCTTTRRRTRCISSILWKKWRGALR